MLRVPLNVGRSAAYCRGNVREFCSVWKVVTLLHKSPPKRSFRHRIHSLLRQADARGSAEIIYRILRISLVCGTGVVIETRKYVTHRISNTNE